MLLSLQTSLKCHNSWVARCVSALDAFPDISRFVSAVRDMEATKSNQPPPLFRWFHPSIFHWEPCPCVCLSLSLYMSHQLLEDYEMDLCLTSIKTVHQSIRKHCMPVDERVRSTVYYVEWRHWYFRQWSFKENAAMRPSDALEAWII